MTDEKWLSIAKVLLNILALSAKEITLILRDYFLRFKLHVIQRSKLIIIYTNIKSLENSKEVSQDDKAKVQEKFEDVRRNFEKLVAEGRKYPGIPYSEVLSFHRRKSFYLGALILFISIIIHALISNHPSLPVTILGFSILILFGLDIALLNWRVANGTYGENRFEGEEFINFLTPHMKNDPPNDKGGPSSRKALRDRTNTASVVAWTGSQEQAI